MSTAQPATHALETLETILQTIVDSDHWWMDCPDRGGFDVNSIRATIAKIRAGQTGVAPQPQPVQPKGCLRCVTPNKCAVWGCVPGTFPAEEPMQLEPLLALALQAPKVYQVKQEVGASIWADVSASEYAQANKLGLTTRIITVTHEGPVR